MAASPESHDRDLRFATRIIHAGESRAPGRTAVPPIYQSTVFELTDPEPSYDEIRYPRLNNTPNHDILSAKLADLEGAESALVLSSGMAAITTTLMHVLRDGGHLLVQDCLYGGTHHFIQHELAAFGMEFDVLPIDDPASWPSLVKPNTRAVYVETMTNPLLDVIDHAEVVGFARECGLASIVDNTFGTPVLFPAAAFGYDYVVHSATKYLNGHSDLCAGVVATSAERMGSLRGFANLLGGSLDAMGCFLLHRGLRTVELRVRQQSATAQRLAEFLAGHDRIATVHYPGLSSHPQHVRAEALFGGDGCGGVLSFELASGSGHDAIQLLGRLDLALHAPSLGGPETLVVRPSASSHASLTREEQQAVGITECLIRIAVGLEHAEDLVEDFGRALAAE